MSYPKDELLKQIRENAADILCSGTADPHVEKLANAVQQLAYILENYLPHSVDEGSR